MGFAFVIIIVIIWENEVQSPYNYFHYRISNISKRQLEWIDAGWLASVLNGGASNDIEQKTKPFNTYNLSVIQHAKSVAVMEKGGKRIKNCNGLKLNYYYYDYYCSLFDCIHRFLCSAICSWTIWCSSLRQHFAKLRLNWIMNGAEKKLH